MLSYRHSFHAGNHADLLKHLVLLALLQKLGEKEKPMSYLDSHAGAGRYDLFSANAMMNAEHESGIARLWQRPVKDPLLMRYLACVASFNTPERLQYYPGSPAIAQWATRPQDRLELLDLQQEELDYLRFYLRADPRVHIHQRDAYEGLVALTPPEPRRGIALIDPSYEQKEDYARVVKTIASVHRRWPVGVLAVWYPRLGAARDRGDWLAQALERERFPSLTRIELTVAPQQQDYGMHGSGMLVVNSPWQLDKTLNASLQEVLTFLGESAAFSLDVISRED